MTSNNDTESVVKHTGEESELNENNDDKLSSIFTRLNVDAPCFVPSGFSVSSAKPNGSIADEQDKSNDSSPTQADGQVTGMNNETKLSPTSSNEDNVADDWETNADDDGDEEDDDDIDDDDDELKDDEQGEEKTLAKKKPKVRKKGGRKISEGQEDKEKKEHVNMVFIGHVDAGKSTIGGQLLYLTGQVDKRTLEKYEREAKEKNRESWYLSWALDTNQEERDKGKTVEVGRASFDTNHKHFTLLDAPGHRGFVPNMISGTCQADLAVLVISARKGEFETGFERGGQTQEHAMLAKTAGVKHMVVLINKMDDPTVEWSAERYEACREKLLPYLKKCGFHPKNELYFMPCSGLTGAFLKEAPSDSECSWYRGLSFLDYIDALPPLTRRVDGPFRLPVVDKYKDMGTVVLGKVESGITRRGTQLLLMPNRKQVEVVQLWSDEVEVAQVVSGESVKIKLKGVEEEEVSPGFVLCDSIDPCNAGRVFDAQVAILEHKSIICPGYSAVLHIHAAVEEVSVKAILCLVDKKTGEKLQKCPRFVKQDQCAIMRLECAGGLICMETFAKFTQMGRFTLRDEGKTIAIGKIVRVVE